MRDSQPGVLGLWNDMESGTIVVDSLFYVLSIQAVGEPPLFLASSIFFAIKDAIRAARAQHGGDNAKQLFKLDSPATPEKIRNACVDQFTTLVRYFSNSRFTPGEDGHPPTGRLEGKVPQRGETSGSVSPGQPWVKDCLH